MGILLGSVQPYKFVRKSLSSIPVSYARSHGLGVSFVLPSSEYLNTLKVFRNLG